jgi:hypothetical protein
LPVEIIKELQRTTDNLIIVYQNTRSGFEIQSESENNLLRWWILVAGKQFLAKKVSAHSWGGFSSKKNTLIVGVFIFYLIVVPKRFYHHQYMWYCLSFPPFKVGFCCACKSQAFPCLVENNIVLSLRICVCHYKMFKVRFAIWRFWFVVVLAGVFLLFFMATSSSYIGTFLVLFLPNCTGFKVGGSGLTRAYTIFHI